MSQEPVPTNSSDDLQFATVEAVDEGGQSTAASPTCVACRQPIESTYYAIGDQIVCPTCREQLDQPVSGSKAGRITKAFFLGLGAGLIGALIWFGIRRVTNLEIGLVAILVGLMVGKAVNVGSGGRGGRVYQVLAVVLTYCCIAANYMPDLIVQFFEESRQNEQAVALDEQKEINAQQDLPAEKDIAANAGNEPMVNAKPEMGLLPAIAAVSLGLVIVFAIALALPFLAGFENVIGILIIGFALWEAWKFNARRELAISGPHQLSPTVAS